MSTKKSLVVAYVIPSDQQAKPKAKEVLLGVIQVLQKHYLNHLGKTFEISSPEWMYTINAPYAASVAIDWDRNVDLIQSNLAQRYVNDECVVLSVLEGTVGDAGGSWNVIKMTGGFWDTVYDKYFSAPERLSEFLPGWSHELVCRPRNSFT